MRNPLVWSSIESVSLVFKSSTLFDLGFTYTMTECFKFLRVASLSYLLQQSLWSSTPKEKHTPSKSGRKQKDNQDCTTNHRLLPFPRRWFHSDRGTNVSLLLDTCAILGNWPPCLQRLRSHDTQTTSWEWTSGLERIPLSSFSLKVHRS